LTEFLSSTLTPAFCVASFLPFFLLRSLPKSLPAARAPRRELRPARKPVTAPLNNGMETNTTPKTPATDPVYGWREAVINSAAERTARSGQPKLVVSFVITDAAASGAVVYGHVSLGDSPRAKALVESFKKALGIPDAGPPDAAKLAGQRIRVRVSPWVGMDGRTRDSITAFAAPAKEYTPSDDKIRVTSEVDDTPF